MPGMGVPADHLHYYPGPCKRTMLMLLALLSLASISMILAAGLRNPSRVGAQGVQEAHLTLGDTPDCVN
jgi:hypothetical protein